LILFEAALYKKVIATLVAGILTFATLPLDAQEVVPGTKQSAVTSPASGTSSVTPAMPRANTLLDETPVKMRIGRTISSADARVGDHVDFEVLEEVRVHDTTVIAKGATASGTVTAAEAKRRMGRGGKLDINLDSVRLVDNEKAALSATEGGKGGGHTGAMVGAMAATAIFTLGGSALFLLMHGKDITIPKGTELTAYISGDMPLEMSRFNTPALGDAPAVAGISQVSIDASVPNCDIEVDGAFAGNTPSQLSLPGGKHDIAVKKKGYVTWVRTLTISGGIHLNAEMDTDTVPAVASGK
jgi:hypothetical protein